MQGSNVGLARIWSSRPTASALALMVAPGEACRNLIRRWRRRFWRGYGYEAIDYTPSRLPRGQSNAVVRSFMAHHQGMSLLSHGPPASEPPYAGRFASDPRFRATMLLLQGTSQTTAFYARIPPSCPNSRWTRTVRAPHIRVFSRPDTPAPEVQLLSNGRYHVY